MAAVIVDRTLSVHLSDRSENSMFVRAALPLLVVFFHVLSANAALTEFRVLLDMDGSANGCTVEGMPGVDRIFTTQVAFGPAEVRVAGASQQDCAGGALGDSVKVSDGGWLSGRAADETLIIETALPLSTFPQQKFPRSRVGVSGHNGSAVHVALVGGNGSPVYFPPAHRRRAVRSLAASQPIVLDGIAEDWAGVAPLFDGIAPAGSDALRLRRVFAVLDEKAGFAYFRFDAAVAIASPAAADDEYSRPEGAPLTVAAPGVLANDDDSGGHPLTAIPVAAAQHGDVVLNSDGSFTYVPDDPASTKIDSFQYKATNGHRESTAARVTIGVSAAGNRPPVAGNDGFSGVEDLPIVAGAPGVLVNDTDADSDPLTATLRSAPSHGTVVLRLDGGFTYLPDENYFGADSFTYDVSDTRSIVTATVTITVSPVNDAPVLTVPQWTVQENSVAGTVVGTVTATDVDSTALVYAMADSAGAFTIDATTGRVIVANGAALNFENAPSMPVNITVQDDGTPSRSAQQSSNILVTNVNDVPVAKDLSVVTPEDTAVALTLAATDEDGDPLTYSLIAPPLHGTLSGTAPNLAYQPAPDFHGVDHVMYAVSDGEASSGTATMSVQVQPVNDAPHAVADVYAVAPGGTLTIPPAAGVLANDSDAEGDDLVARLLAPPANGTIALGSDGSFVYIPQTGFSGVDTFTYETVEATDAASAAAAPATVSINVHAANAVPVAAPQSVSTPEDSSRVITLTASDADGDAVDFAIATQPAHGSLEMNGPAVTYIPAAHFHGSDHFTFTANDGFGASAPATISLTVHPENDAPRAVADVYGVAAGGTLTVPASGFLANDTDVDGAPPSAASIVDSALHGTLTAGSDGAFVYTPHAGFTGTDRFRYRASDGALLSATTDVTINVHNANARPEAHAATVAANEDSAIAITVTGSDADGDGLTFSIVSPPAHGSLAGAAPHLVYTPHPNAHGSDSFQFTVSDGIAVSDPATVTIAVAAANDAPVAAADSFLTDEDTPLHGSSVLANDSDIDGGAPGSAVLDRNVEHGTLAFHADGTFVYTPHANFEGSDIFSYRTGDGAAESNVALVSIAVAAVNDAPAVQPATFSIDENSISGSPVGTVPFTDADASQAHTFSITAGNTGGAFTIDAATGAIAVANAVALDFESTSSFALTVVVTDDGSPARSGSATIAVGVIDRNEAPAAGDASFSVAEHSVAGTVIGTVHATDPDAGQSLAFAIESSNAPGAFTIDSQTGAIRVANAPSVDFEANPTITLSVSVTDDGAGALSHTATVTIAVSDVNELPAVSPASFALAENSPNGTAVGTAALTDPDGGQTHTWMIQAGTPFAIDEHTGAITVADGAALDFESTPVISFNITATDNGAGPLSGSATITVTLTNANDAPTSVALTGAVVPENAAASAIAGVLATADADAGDSFTYALVAGAGSSGNGAFTIIGNELRTAAAFDFETQASYTVRVRSTDAGGLFVEETFTITVANVNESPTDLALSASAADENLSSGALVGTLSATDVDAGETFTYSLVAGAGSDDNASFTITGNELRTAATFDFETKATHSIRIRTADIAGALHEEQFTIAINNQNDGPTAVLLSNGSVAENLAAGAPVGTLSTTDQDSADTFTYALVAGAGDEDNASFRITGNQLETQTSFDHEAKAAYTVRVRTTDSGGVNVEAQFTIAIADGNDAPSDVALGTTSVNEALPAGSTVGTLSSADADAGDSFTYSLVAGTGGDDNALFAIAGDALQTGAVFDYESRSAYTIRIRSTDSAGATVEKAFAISIADRNDAPSGLTMSGGTVAENEPAGVTVGTFTSTDADAGDTHSYTLVSGTGSDDNAAFAVSGTTLITAGSFDRETRDTYSVRVRSTDTGGASYETAFTISVTNVNEAPASVALAPNTVAEAQPAGTTVGNLTASDVDAGDIFTFALVAGAGSTDNASFAVAGNELRTNAILDHEAQPAYSVRIRVTDAGGLSHEAVLAIATIDVNDAPSGIALASAGLAENQPAGTAAGTLTATDDDALDTHSFSLVAGAGADDNAQFTIVANELRTTAPLDHERVSPYSIRVQTLDSGGLTFEQVFVIAPADVNEAPTDLSVTPAAVDENRPAGTVVGTLSSTDQDAGATHTYALVAGAGSADNAAFQIVGNELRTNATFDYETDHDYSVRLESTDEDGLTYVESVAISINDVNDPPVLDDAARNINENSPNGTPVGAVLPYSDPDAGQSHTFTILDGNASGAFAIGANGQITVADVTDLNYEAVTQFVLTILITDNGTPALTDTAVVTIAINDVNEAPTAAADAFTYVGNTELRIDGHAGSANAIAFTASTSNPLDNDTDPDGPASGFATLSLVPVAAGTSAQNGTYRIAADGTMYYTPPAGHTGSDSIAYQLTDGTHVVNGTINFSMTGTDVVWYVRNNDATADGVATRDGTSSHPFNTLAAASTASDVNEIIYVHAGSGTTTGQNAGITLKNGQKLIGAGVALVVNGSTTLIAAGAQPQIGNAAGAGVTATNVSNGAIRGMNIAGSADAVYVSTTGTSSGSVIIANNTIRAAGNEGIDVDGAGSGTLTIGVSDNVITAGGNAIDIARTAGTLYVTTFANNTIEGTTGGGGVAVTGAIFDAVPGVPFQEVAGGTTLVGSAVDAVGTTGIVLTGVSGDLSFARLDIYANSGAALRATATNVYNGSAGFRFTARSGSDTIESKNGVAIDLTTVTIDLGELTVKSANTTTYGVSLDGVGGTFTAGTSSAIRTIASAAATAYRINASSVVATWNGTIETTQGSGISLTGNSGAYAFTGTLTLSTGANPAFVATTSGSVTSTAAASTITTTTGAAVNISNTSIGAAGVTFRTVNAGTAGSGPAQGIRLSAAGTGPFRVTGTGAAGSGGTIQKAVTNAVYAQTAGALTLNAMILTTAGDDGIFANDIDGLTMTQSSVTNNGDQSGDAGMQIENVSGTVALTNLTATGNAHNNVHFNNNTGTVSVTITGGTIGHNRHLPLSASGLLIEGHNSAIFSQIHVTNGTYTNNFSNGILINANNTTSMNDVRITGANFSDNNFHVQCNQSHSASMTCRVMNNSLINDTRRASSGSNAGSTAIILGSSATATGGTLNGRVSGNTIGDALVAGSGSSIGNGIRVVAQGGTSNTITIVDNVIRQIPLGRGIEILAIGHTVIGQTLPFADITVTGNNVNPQDTTGFPLAGIYLAADSQGSPARVRADIRGNTVPAGTNGWDGPSFDGTGRYLVYHQVGGATAQLVDTTSPVSGTAQSELAGTNTGSAAAAGTITLISGSISTVSP